TSEPSNNHPDRAAPGVYVTEIPAFGSSIVGVSTTDPIFIGYTGCARELTPGAPCYNMTVRVSSFADYSYYFGGAAPGGDFNLFSQLKLFWENGGGSCYIVSVGSYWEGQMPATVPDPVPSDWMLRTMAANDLVNGLDVA